jgi:alkylhydroperoxidase family enzyme
LKPSTERINNAALAWTEAVTRAADTGVPDDVYARTAEQFTENELLDLTFAVIAINSCNRPAISSRAKVGTYHPKPKEKAPKG